MKGFSRRVVVNAITETHNNSTLEYSYVLRDEDRDRGSKNVFQKIADYFLISLFKSLVLLRPTLMRELKHYAT